MERYGLLLATLLAGCGARTDLGAPVTTTLADGGTTGDGKAPTTCMVSATTTLATGTLQNVDVRLDDTSVYWNDGTAIRRVSKQGGVATAVATGAIDIGGYDVAGGSAYFVTRGSSEVQQAGGGTIATLAGPIERVVASAGALWVVAPFGNSEGLYHVPLGGGSPNLVASLGIASQTPEGDYPQGVYGLVIRDAVAYLAMIGYPPNAYIIASVDLGTGSLTQLSATTLSLPATSLAVDDAFVYFADYVDQASPAIWRVPIGGGNAGPVVPTATYCASCMFPAPLAVGSGQLFFTSDEEGTTLRSLPTAGGPASVVSGPGAGASVTGIATDGACVYWVALNDQAVRAAPAVAP